MSMVHLGLPGRELPKEGRNEEQIMSQSELWGLEFGSRALPWEMGCSSGLGGRRLASFPDWPHHFSPVSESRRGQGHCQSWRHTQQSVLGLVPWGGS